MASKTKIVDGVTIVSNKETRLTYAFKKTGTKMVAVSTAYCAEGDKFNHKVGRSLVFGRIDENQGIQLPIGDLGGHEIADVIDVMFSVAI